MSNAIHNLFDLLHLDGADTTRVPPTWRKWLLRMHFQFTPSLRYTTHLVEDGEAACRAACVRGDEGVIAKRADSTYQGRRSANWLKFKCSREQEFAVVGYTTCRYQLAVVVSRHARLSRTDQTTSPVTSGLARAPLACAPTRLLTRW